LDFRHTALFRILFALNFQTSVGALFSGYALSMIGFAGTGEFVASDVPWRLGAVTLLVGPFISMLASILIMKYPVTISLLNEFRSRKQTEIIKK
jgi:hypothetical protein